MLIHEAIFDNKPLKCYIWRIGLCWNFETSESRS